MVFFSWVNKITVVVSIVIGAIQVVYHVLIAIIWAATWTDEYKHYPLQNCFLYWITILFSLILIALTIFLRIRIDFLIKPQEDIEKMEVEEMRREQMETEDDRITTARDWAIMQQVTFPQWLAEHGNEQGGATHA